MIQHYDQSLSTIEKGCFVDIIQKKKKKNNLETVLPHIQGRDSSEVSEVLNPLLSQENLNYYQDKRLIRICQVPQMPYLEKDIVTGIWKPTKETVEAVKKGTLFIEKVGQKYVINDFIKKDGLIKRPDLFWNMKKISQINFKIILTK